MKIVHVIQSLDPAAGGPPVVAARLGAAQATMGHEVWIVAYETPDAAGRISKSFGSVPGYDQVRVVGLHGHGLRERLFAPGAREEMKKLGSGAAVFHLHGVWDSVLRAAASAAGSLGVPYVVTPHGMLDPWTLRQSFAKQLKKKIALALVYKRMLAGAMFLHVLNADESRLLAPLGLRAPLEVFPNGIFIEEFERLPPRGSFRNTHPELGDDPFVLFLSRLHFKKGLDYLVDAFARLRAKHPSLRVVIAGPDDGYRDTLEQRIAEKRVGDRVHLVGPLYGDDKLAALVDSSLFCLPSRQEGFSMAITEAMACRLPVVVSDQCHFPEVADSGAGRVVACDEAQVANAIDEVISDASIARRMGNAGRELVEQRYTWRSIAFGMVAAYERRRTPRR